MVEKPDAPDLADLADLVARLRAVEERLDALEARDPKPDPDACGPDAGGVWLADELARSTGEVDAPDGSVIFAGHVNVGGQEYRYQWRRPTHLLLDGAWDENLERLAALAHPARGAVLRRLLHAPATAAELVEEEVVSSTGTAYHHLGALQAAGWTAKDGHGRHSVRPARIIPLLTIITASEAH